MAGKSSSKKGAPVVRPTAEAFATLKAAGIACGVEARAMERLVARLQGRSLSAKGGRLRLDDKELLALIDDRLARVFQHLDDFALGQVGARDLVVAAGILFDKRQLLKGEPTLITKFQDMRKLDELAEALNKEMQRRGKLVDVTPTSA